jgi:hypothetical protein
MRQIVAWALVLCASAPPTATLGQAPPITLKAAVVALTDDAALRESFERDLVARARNSNYDAITSYDIQRDVRDVDDRRFVEALRSRGVSAVLMMRPAAVGEGASLESVRNEVSPRLYDDMQKFARRVSETDTNDLIAVVHLGIYMITGNRPDLISAGAVWLDEPVTDRAEGLERLQDLIVANVDKNRPELRRYLGLPPLP